MIMVGKTIDWEKIDQMLIAGCTGVQCAASIGVHPDTLYLRCRNEKNTDFTAYLQEKRSHGDALLHAAQFAKAYKEKHPAMLIWLGKQRLGQKDDIENHEVKDLGIKFDEQMKQVISLLNPKEEIQENPPQIDE